MGPVSTAVDVLHADRAVVVGGVGETFVLLAPGQAETAGVAVCEVLRTSDPAAQTIRARREFLSAVRQSRTVETLRSLHSRCYHSHWLHCLALHNYHCPQEFKSKAQRPFFF